MIVDQEYYEKYKCVLEILHRMELDGLLTSRLGEDGQIRWRGTAKLGRRKLIADTRLPADII